MMMHSREVAGVGGGVGGANGREGERPRML